MNYSDEWADAKEVSAPPPEVKKRSVRQWTVLNTSRSLGQV